MEGWNKKEKNATRAKAGFSSALLLCRLGGPPTIRARRGGMGCEKKTKIVLHINGLLSSVLG